MLPRFDASNITDEALLAYDTIKVEKVAPLGIAFWTEVLKELDVRGKVKLISGSYDDIGNALITRLG